MIKILKNKKFLVASTFTRLKSKKGLSAIVTLMILILIILVAGGLIFVGIKQTVTKKLESSGSCYDIFEKVKINSEFTCYDSSTNETQFSIDVGEIEFEGILVAISEEDSSKNFQLTNELQEISGLTNFGGIEGESVIAPGKNSGKTYVASDFSLIPLEIEIALIINGNTCGVSDSLTNIGEC